MSVRTALTWLMIMFAVFCYWRIDAGDTSGAMRFGTVGAMCGFLLYGFALRVQCRVTTTNSGRPCKSFGRGVFLGCHHHRWEKFQARFGRHPVVRRAPGGPRPTERVTAVDEGRRERINFWVPIVALLVATISMITDVHGLFD
ncbi:hypothetical protein NLX83_25585 [Allokutzneria sp. A3M-2-11 16]|uniref:hypothetical protein n=1 Tax=Allokutzneria sp. A3M-2-11 16 TaxID=2962043 RepID=UPI0020B68BEE|nr:hypothetical protein [Allokutzneria sp. A3M-2-11 16]MCP3802650.1 hypothetical protein [Allokutzneria sp. A3M-2-11 16]